MAIKILFIITGLEAHGAQLMLYKLLSQLDRAAFQPEVISLTGIEPVGRKLKELHIPVTDLRMRRGIPGPVSILKLAWSIRQCRPNLIQTWMYHADLVGGCAARLAGRTPVIWGIRQSNLDPQSSKRTTIWTVKACAWASRWLPVRIVCCSHVSQEVHFRLGYKGSKMLVISNGFDLEAFQPTPNMRVSVRQELDIPMNFPLIGIVARFDPQKDHYNFVQAAAHVHKRFPKTHFLLCGDGIDVQNGELAGWIEKAGITDCCHLLGSREDVPRLTAALDIATSTSSYGEGFPNVIGEAMACGVPCVVTDVGDSGFIVGDTGRVVSPKDPVALAEAYMDILQLDDTEWLQLGRAARQRVEQYFSLPAITRQYETLYREVAV